MGKLIEEETGEMKQRKGREVGRKEAEKSRERMEDRWGEILGGIRGTRWGERERGKGTETWGENEKARGRERGRGRDSRRQGKVKEETGKSERRNWGTLALPEIKGTQISMCCQPSCSSILSPRGFKEKKETAAGRRSWGGWPSQSSSPHPPETSPTHLPRVQQEVEPLCSSTMGTPSMHREAGTEPCLCLCLCIYVYVGGWGCKEILFMRCVIVLACSVALSKSLAFPKEGHPRLLGRPDSWTVL